MTNETVRFITVWCRDPSMMLTVNAASIVSVHPNIGPNGDFDGSVLTMVDGDVYTIDESTRTVTARLGVGEGD